MHEWLIDNLKSLYRKYDAVIIAVSASLLVSALILFQNQPFNFDGILYLKTAKIYWDEGLHAAKLTYYWPFFSIAIAWLSHLTGLSYLNAARLFDVTTCAFITALFTLLVKALGGTKREQFIAIIVVLLFPTFFHYRGNILRDYGYLSFILLSVWIYLQFLRNLKLSYALLWSISTFFASLFRIEGFIFLWLVPISIWFRPETRITKKALGFLQLNLLSMICFEIIILFLIIGGHETNSLGRFNELLNNIFHPLETHLSVYHDKIHDLENAIFNLSVQAKVAKYFYFGGIISLFIASLLLALTPFYCLLAASGFANHLIPWDKHARLTIVAYIIANIVALLDFISRQLILSNRYMLALTFMLMLAVPFTIEKFYQFWRDNNKRKINWGWCFPLICLFFAGSLISKIFQIGPSKTYVINAGNWVQKHTPSQSTFFFDEPSLFYYSNRPGMRFPEDIDFTPSHCGYRSLDYIELSKFQYFAILVQKNEISGALEVFKRHQLTTLKTFKNNFDDVIYILVQTNTKTNSEQKNLAQTVHPLANNKTKSA